MVDRLLVARCRQGSKEALRRIYEKYRDDVLILAIALSHDVDPRQWVRRFMAADYQPLGQDVINGVKVEGVEINELGVIRKWSGQTPIEDYAARLWVDVESLLPVRIEEEGTLGTIRYGGGGDRFEWNAPLTVADIEPDIPGDYTLVQ